jgi:hypothetical protein
MADEKDTGYSRAAMDPTSAKAQADALERKIQLGEIDPRTFRMPGSELTLEEERQRLAQSTREELEAREQRDRAASRKQSMKGERHIDNAKLVASHAGNILVHPGTEPDGESSPDMHEQSNNQTSGADSDTDEEGNE